MPTRPYGNPASARLLVIGHDPRLQRSDTLAEFAFFADYFFQQEPRAPGEKQKYELARSLYKYIDYLTDASCVPKAVLVTNLCNEALARPSKGTVFIDEEHASQGIRDIEGLIRDSSIRAIVAMSQQVNYWLQQLGFCEHVKDFLDGAAPAPQGLRSEPPSYKGRKSGIFRTICGRVLKGRLAPVVPVVHVKNWPLKGRFTVYRECHADARHHLPNLISTA